MLGLAIDGLTSLIRAVCLADGFNFFSLRSKRCQWGQLQQEGELSPRPHYELSALVSVAVSVTFSAACGASSTLTSGAGIRPSSTACSWFSGS